MSLETIVNEIHESFVQKSANARMILLHSAGRYRSVLLSRLLSDQYARVLLRDGSR